MKKRSKSKKAAVPRIDPYLEGLIGKLLERLVALEKKIDLVVSRTAGKSSGNGGSARPLSVPAPPRRDRTLYEAVCAECSKVCEVPFQPVEGRPVYCKECWAQRKGGGPARSMHGMPVLTPVAVRAKPAGKLGGGLGSLRPKATPSESRRRPGKPRRINR